MSDWQERTALLFGIDQLKQLKNSHVLVVGLGGVGAFAAEQIARVGIGKMTIVDGDMVTSSNKNRQLLALDSSLGKNKAGLMRDRLLDINPQLQLEVISDYITADDMPQLLERKYDYVVDAIDTLAPKIHLIYHSLQKRLPIVSSMGAGGKTDPSQIHISDISETYNDKLARMLRKRLHKKKVYTGVKVVFSSEEINPNSVVLTQGELNKRTTVGTVSYMPGLFGHFIASVVIRDILGIKI
ncbi:MAG: tRNA threonylcarbamoyladenosine dehydratase [Bacteroidetes bacterium 4572_77]|nr:MAG: tRNA threonylcarbamoyladenosine dehydratase [Bacteroidetes bacterium 4572_77]